MERSLARSLAIVEQRSPGGELIGLARAIGDGMYVVIVDVVVHPAHQGRGVGRALVEQIVTSFAVDHGNHVALFAAPDVVPFYEALGWRPEPGSYLRR